MDESFSPTIFLYGMALVLAGGKAFMLWRTLPKPRLGLRQEKLHAWKNRRLQKQAATSPVQHPRSEPTVDNPMKNAEGEPHATMPTSEQGSATQSRSNPAPEK